MAPTAAAMELKVLISIMQSGTALQSILSQVKQLSQAFTGLQAQASAAGASAATAAATSPVPAAGTGLMARIAAAATAATQASAGAAAGLAGVGQAAAGATPPTLTLATAVTGLTNGLRFLAGGFLAIQGVSFLKNLADTAARAEVLQTVLHVVAMNAGITGKEIDKVDKQVQKLGITATASRQSLTQFLQAGLNIRFAAPLARAAQDLAVIAGMDSSGTFQRLILNIQQLDTMGLRWMGIVVSRTEAEKRYKDMHREITGELSQRQRQEALLQEVLRKSESIAGVYEASMGDVGKQTQSLKRFTEGLKVAVGDQLLPAYSVLVSELTNFLAKAQVTAEVMRDTGSAAQDLATAVGVVARTINQVATFLLEHAEAVMFVVKAYIAWRVAWKIYDLIGGAMTLLHRLELQIISVAAATQGATAATTLWAAAMATLNLVAITGAIIAMGFALVETAKATRGLWRAIEEGRTFEFFTARDEDNLIRRMLSMDRASIEEERIINARLSQNAALRASQRQLFEATDRESEAQREYATAMKGGTQAAEDAALAKYNVAKADKAAAVEAVAAAKARLEVEDPERARVEERRARENAELDRLKKHGESMMQAQEELFGGKIALTDENKPLPIPFQQAIGNLSKFVADFDEISKKPAESTGRLKEAFDSLGELPKSVAQIREGLRLVVPTVTNAEALKQFEVQVGEIRKRFTAAGAEAKDFTDLNRVQALARLNAAAGERQLFAPLEAERSAKFKEEQSRYSDHIQTVVTMTKSRNELQANLDKDQYDRGLMTLDEYFAARMVRLREESGLELQVAINNVRAIQEEQRQGFAKTDPERQALRTRLENAQNRLRELSGDEKTPSAFRKSERELRLTQETERRNISRQVLDLELQTAAAYGSEAEAIAVINQQSAVRLENLRGVAGAREAVEADRQLQIQRTEASFRQMALDRELEGVGIKRQALDLEQARLGVERRRTEIAERLGTISEREAMRQRNTQAIEQRRIDRGRLAVLEEEVARKQLQIEKETLAVINAQIAAGQSATSTATTDKIREATQGLKDDVNAATASIIELKAETRNFSLEFETFGLKFQRAFSDSLGQLLEDLTFSLKKGTDLIQEFGVALGRQVVGTYTKQLADATGRFIGGIGAAKDDTGKAIPGTGLFNKLFPGLNAQPKKDGSSADKALYVQEIKPRGAGGVLSANVTTSEQIAGGQKFLGDVPSFGELFSIAAPTGGATGGGGGAAETVGKLVPVMDRLVSELFKKRAAMSLGGMTAGVGGLFGSIAVPSLAGGGVVTGPGTGTSDSVPILASAGEHVMPAARVQTWLPVLEGIRLGKILPYSTGGVVQSIAPSSIIPRRYANGGVVVSDGGAASVQPGGGGGPSNMVVTMHPDTLNMTMREWLEHEVVRQHGRR